MLALSEPRLPVLVDAAVEAVNAAYAEWAERNPDFTVWGNNRVGVLP